MILGMVSFFMSLLSAGCVTSRCLRLRSGNHNALTECVSRTGGWWKPIGHIPNFFFSTAVLRSPGPNPVDLTAPEV